MIEPDQIKKDIAAIEAELHRAYGVKVDGLEAKLRKVGRRMPKAQHRHAKVLIAAQKQAGHPKLRTQIKPKKVAKARAELLTFLTGVDPKSRRKGAVLGALGGLAFNLILAAVLLYLFFSWRGSF